MTSHAQIETELDIEDEGEPEETDDEGDGGDEGDGEGDVDGNDAGNRTGGSNDPDHPPDYDYPGFSRGSEYHAKSKAGGEMKEEGHHGEGGPKGHHRNDYGHCE